MSKNTIMTMEQNEKMIIYQVFTRLFGNNEVNNVYNGSLQ